MNCYKPFIVLYVKSSAEILRYLPVYTGWSYRTLNNVKIVTQNVSSTPKFELELWCFNSLLVLHFFFPIYSPTKVNCYTNLRNTFLEHNLFNFRSRVKKQRDQEKQRAHDDRHWSKKSLEEMAERDWRILREDFTISTKGEHLIYILNENI